MGFWVKNPSFVLIDSSNHTKDGYGHLRPDIKPHLLAGIWAVVCAQKRHVFNIKSEFSATPSAKQKARTPHQSWLQVLPLPHPESSPPGCQAMVAWWRHHNQPTLSLPPRKLTWHWNKWWIFHCHVSFQGVYRDNAEFSDGNPEIKPMTNSIQQLLVIWGPHHLNKSFRSHATRFHWHWCFQASHETCLYPLPTHPPNLPWHWI